MTKDLIIEWFCKKLQWLLKVLYARVSDPIWVSRDGRDTRISQMDDRHLWNSIEMMKREGKDSGLMYDHLVKEKAKRGLRTPEPYRHRTPAEWREHYDAFQEKGSRASNIPAVNKEVP